MNVLPEGEFGCYKIGTSGHCPQWTCHNYNPGKNDLELIGAKMVTMSGVSDTAIEPTPWVVTFAVGKANIN